MKSFTDQLPRKLSPAEHKAYSRSANTQHTLTKHQPGNSIQLFFLKNKNMKFGIQLALASFIYSRSPFYDSV